MTSLTLSLLGPPEIRLDDRALAFGIRKAFALLAYLAVTASPHPRDALAALFWPEADSAKARTSLRQVLWSLHHAGLAGWIETVKETVGLRPGYTLDTLEFQALVAQERVHHHLDGAACAMCAESFSQAAALYRGEFLSGFTLKDSPEFDEWQRFQAESLRQTLAGVLKQLVGLLSVEGDVEKALTYARRWVSLDPLYEPAQRSLMRLYAQSGKRGLALKQYENLRQVLDQELGVQPEAESLTLFQDIMERRFDPAPEMPPHSLQNRIKHNLPAQMTSFVGRDWEISQIQELLSPDSANGQPARLLTLIGPGGAGKTRLAQQVASHLLQAFPGGVWFVGLAGFSDPTLVPRIVAAVIGLLEQPDQDTTETLIHYFRSRPPMLLVLDNAEHLLIACADLSASLLRHCPNLCILATSRQILGVSGEITMSLSGLSLTPKTDPSSPIVKPISTAAPSLPQSEAVRLFLDRVRLVQPLFSITPKNLPAVEQICTSVDGMPLAIELAAARLKVLSPEEIAARLNDHFRLLKTNSWDVEERHKTLRNTVDWSYQLLNEEERTLFNRLAVFWGSFNLEAVENICMEAGEESLDLLTSLLEKSMAVREPEGNFGVRYRLLETLRQYGLERLAQSQTLETIQRRHTHYFIEFVEKAALEIRGHQQAVWFIRLEEEYDNIRAALSWAFAQVKQDGDPVALEIAARLIKALLWFWFIQKPVEGKEWLERCLTQPLDQLPPRLLTYIYSHSSLFDYWVKDANNLCEQSLSIALQMEDEESIAVSLLFLGWLSAGNKPGQANERIEQGLSIFRQIEYPDPFYVSTALFALGTTLHGKPDLISYARTHYLESLDMCLKAGNYFYAAMSLFNLSDISLLMGNLIEARSFLQKAYSLSRENGLNREGRISIGLYYVEMNLGNYDQAVSWLDESFQSVQRLTSLIKAENYYVFYGDLARIQGHLEQAELYYQKVLSLPTSEMIFPSEALFGLGHIALAKGDYSSALPLHTQALTIRNQGGTFEGASANDLFQSVDALADSLAANKQFEKAVCLFAALETFLKKNGFHLHPIDQKEHDRWLTFARDHLAGTAFTHAWNEGEILSAKGWQELVSYALAQSSPSQR